MKKNSKVMYAAEYRKSLGELANMSPINGLLDEMDRMERIRNDLYQACTDGKTVDGYTNKAGATNQVVNPAIKEYKAYSQRYADLCKTIEGIVKARAPELYQESTYQPDEFEKLLG